MVNEARAATRFGPRGGYLLISFKGVTVRLRLGSAATVFLSTEAAVGLGPCYGMKHGVAHDAGTCSVSAVFQVGRNGQAEGHQGRCPTPRTCMQLLSHPC